MSDERWRLQLSRNGSRIQTHRSNDAEPSTPASPATDPLLTNNQKKSIKDDCPEDELFKYKQWVHNLPNFAFIFPFNSGLGLLLVSGSNWWPMPNPFWAIWMHQELWKRTPRTAFNRGSAWRKNMQIASIPKSTPWSPDHQNLKTFQSPLAIGQICTKLRIIHPVATPSQISSTLLVF